MRQKHDAFISYQIYNKTLDVAFWSNVDGWPEPIHDFFTLRTVIVNIFFIVTYNFIQKLLFDEKAIKSK